MTVSNIKYPQERNVTTAGYRLSMCEAGVLGALCSKSVYLLFRLILCYNLLPLPNQKMFSVELHVGYEEDIILLGSTSQKYLFG